MPRGHFQLRINLGRELPSEARYCALRAENEFAKEDEVFSTRWFCPAFRRFIIREAIMVGYKGCCKKIDEMV